MNFYFELYLHRKAKLDPIFPNLDWAIMRVYAESCFHYEFVYLPEP